MGESGGEKRPGSCVVGLAVVQSVSRSISVGKHMALSDLVKVSRLASLSGIPGQTLATKLKRGTPFSVAESRQLARTLREHGRAVR